MRITDIYGEASFNDDAMKKHLSPNAYSLLKETLEEGRPLSVEIADEVAHAMQEWATDKGATHFTHWFQPLNEMTAEKHDAFLGFNKDGGAISEFSGKELIKGESDASSFPSGGLRATFEARGYTAWDCTSPAFVKDKTLYIPTIFCSYTGEALDKKTPLLRSMEAVNIEAIRVLRHLGDNETTKVIASVGAEQEYFLVDREVYEKRLDLMLCGRTLFGAMPPKGQEMDDHYYGRLRLRITDYMHELDRELWALGVPAKTKHNEAAPAQHELACIYDTANIACDQNQITMESMRTIAKKKGLACLLHEKPFSGLSGSGKHVNWSLSTNGGKNLFSPGKNPSENLSFLLFTAAMIAGVDEYQDLMRFSSATASNDTRLGAHEAPPAVISVFLGDELCEIYEAIENSHSVEKRNTVSLDTGVVSVPTFNKDTTDRNRTSPCAFTGNKFEFRMCGSSASIARPCYIINTVMAEELRLIADRLDKCTSDKVSEVNNIIRDLIHNHKRILYNGNNYSDEWKKEAAKRGLLDIPTTPEAIACLKLEKNIELFTRHGVMNEAEVLSRHEICSETYSKAINIESLIMQDMATKSILPAVMHYCGKLSRDINDTYKAGGKTGVMKTKLKKLTKILKLADKALSTLKIKHSEAYSVSGAAERSMAYKNLVVPAMATLRRYCDELEVLVPEESWPIPSYTDLLYRI